MVLVGNEKEPWELGVPEVTSRDVELMQRSGPDGEYLLLHNRCDGSRAMAKRMMVYGQHNGIRGWFWRELNPDENKYMPRSYAEELDQMRRNFDRYTESLASTDHAIRTIRRLRDITGTGRTRRSHLP